VQGVQHHTQLCLRPLIGVDTLFFDPELVCLLRGITTYIDGITISCNISRGMSNTVILSSGHDLITVSIDKWKHDYTLFQVPRRTSLLHFAVKTYFRELTLLDVSKFSK
jgi:hypothetical protein